jgi:hypothetical protein
MIDTHMIKVKEFQLFVGEEEKRGSRETRKGKNRKRSTSEPCCHPFFSNAYDRPVAI